MHTDFMQECNESLAFLVETSNRPAARFCLRPDPLIKITFVSLARSVVFVSNATFLQFELINDNSYETIN